MSAKADFETGFDREEEINNASGEPESANIAG